MIHSVGTYGAAGSLEQGLGYGYGELDHNNNIREEVTHLRGNPDQLLELEKTLTTKNTYIHTSLSFTGKEADMLNNNPDKLDAIIDSYIEQMAAGLPSPDRLPYCCVKHGEPDKFHVEFLILRMDLETGKSYQPFVKQRGDIARFQDWNVTMQAKHGLENPNAIEHQKTSSWSKNLPKQAKDIRDKVDNKISAMVEANQINNRQQIIDFINQTEGMEVARITPSAISIKVDGHKQNIKLQGALYADTFTDIKSVRQAMERRAEINVEQSQQRLSTSMQKFAKASHYKYEKSSLDVGADTTGNQPNAVSRVANMDMGQGTVNGTELQHSGGTTHEDDRRTAMAKGKSMPAGQQRAKLGTADKKEIKKPGHRIFNGVDFDINKQAWRWQGSHGYAQVTPTNEGYSIANGNKMEWTMAAQLLKDDGASHVSLTCATEQSMYRAIKAHAEAGLKISSIILDGQQLSTEQIKEMVKQHDNSIKINSNSIINKRAGQEGQTGSDISEISRRATTINTTLTDFANGIERASRPVERLIGTIEDELEARQQEEEQEHSYSYGR